METKTVQVMGAGSPIVDLVAEIDDSILTSVQGEKGGMELVDADTLKSLESLLAEIPIKAPGGSAANTIFALARMGMACSFLGKLGRDENGIYYKNEFKSLGGDCSSFKHDDKNVTACCLSLVTPDSERTMRTHLGAAMTLAPDDIKDSDFINCRHVHVEGYLLFNPDLLTAVLKSARNAECSVSLDLGSFEVVRSAEKILPDLLADYVDMVFANEDEAAAFCNDTDPEKGLEALGRLCRISAVKIGKDGSWLKQGNQVVHVPAIPVDDAVDTTGAGDFWASGFLFGYLNGYSLNTCGKIGSVLGKHVVRHFGANLPASAWEAVQTETRSLLENERKAI
ncbi:adenosine kinase [Desulfobacterales bacterium HSG16]|nr:adenosine kinase [Desulfobacterales bacterium HSG16]